MATTFIGERDSALEEITVGRDSFEPEGERLFGSAPPFPARQSLALPKQTGLAPPTTRSSEGSSRRLSSREDLGAQFERAVSVGFLPEQLVGRRQHLRDLEFARLGQPAVKNFEKRVALQIDKNRLGVLVAMFCAARSEADSRSLLSL